VAAVFTGRCIRSSGDKKATGNITEARERTVMELVKAHMRYQCDTRGMGLFVFGAIGGFGNGSDRQHSVLPMIRVRAMIEEGRLRIRSRLMKEAQQVSYKRLSQAPGCLGGLGAYQRFKSFLHPIMVKVRGVR
jgi:hypothetical protein